MEELVTVAEVEGSRASLVAALLENQGLTVFIENENTSVMLPHLAIYAKVRVPRDQVDAAREALQAAPPMDDDSDDIELDD